MEENVYLSVRISTEFLTELLSTGIKIYNLTDGLKPTDKFAGHRLDGGEFAFFFRRGNPPEGSAVRELMMTCHAPFGKNLELCGL